MLEKERNSWNKKLAVIQLPVGNIYKNFYHKLSDVREEKNI